MKKLFIFIFALYFSLLPFAPLVFAGPSSTHFELKEYGFGAGGSSNSASTNFGIFGTLGEIDMGSPSSTNFRLGAGLAYTLMANTPPAPTLTNPATNYDRLKVVIATPSGGLARSSSGLLVYDNFSTDTSANYTVESGSLSVSGGNLINSGNDNVAAYKNTNQAKCVTVASNVVNNRFAGPAIWQASDVTQTTNINGYGLTENNAYWWNWYEKLNDANVDSSGFDTNNLTVSTSRMRIYLDATGLMARGGETSLGPFSHDWNDTTYTSAGYPGIQYASTNNMTVDWFEARTDYRITVNGLPSGYYVKVSDGTTTAKAQESSGTAVVDAGAVLFPLTSIAVYNADPDSGGSLVASLNASNYSDMGGGDTYTYTNSSPRNPSDTTYAVSISTDNFVNDIKYVKTDKTIGTTLTGSDFLDYATGWGGATGTFITGLRNNTAYSIRVKAREGNFTDSFWSAPSTIVSTSDPSLTFGLDTYNIQFANLNQANSYTDSAKQTVMTTSTNAYNGYVVYAKEDQPLTSGASKTIADFSSPNSLPTTWSGTGFGYNSNDADLETGPGATDRFTGSKYAGFSSSAQNPVADHTAKVQDPSISGETFTILYRVTASSTQEAGNYKNTVIYTIVPIY